MGKSAAGQRIFCAVKNFFCGAFPAYIVKPLKKWFDDTILTARRPVPAGQPMEMAHDTEIRFSSSFSITP
jgi:hypothetical protein